MTASALSSSRDGSVLIRLLSRQRDLYVHLKTLSDQQASLIHQEQTDQLLSLLAQRQRLVDALGKLNQELVVYRKANPDLQAGLDPDQRSAVRSLMGEVESLLQQIIEQDDRDRAHLQSAQQRVGSQIRQVRQAGAAVNAYRVAAPAAGARLTDRRG